MERDRRRGESAADRAGGLIVEVVFSWPGIGKLLYERALQTDYSTVLGITTFAALLVVVGNLLADVLYAWLLELLEALVRRLVSTHLVASSPIGAAFPGDAF